MSTQIDAPKGGELPPQRAGRPSLRLEFLDGLRGLAALYVVVFHLFNCDGLPRWATLCLLPLHMGHNAVTVFIALSGFSLMIPVVLSQDRALKGGTLGYLKRRAWRIMPPYYAALAVSLLVLAISPEGLAFVHGVRDREWMMNFSLLPLVSHLFLFHNLQLAWSNPINVPMWSVATEWQIYFALPFVLLPVWRRFGAAPMVVAGFLVGMVPMSAALWHQNLSSACLWYLGVFALGAFGAILSFGAGAQGSGLLTTNKGLLSLTAAAFVSYILVARYLPPIHVSATASDFGTRFYVIEALKDLSIGVGVMCLLVFCARERHATPPPLVLRLFCSRFAKTFGSFSYSLYLTHIIVQGPSGHLAQALHLSPLANLVFRGLIIIPAVIGFAYAFYLIFERPFVVRRKQEKQGEGQVGAVSRSVSS